MKEYFKWILLLLVVGIIGLSGCDLEQNLYSIELKNASQHTIILEKFQINHKSQIENTMVMSAALVGDMAISSVYRALWSTKTIKIYIEIFDEKLNEKMIFSQKLRNENAIGNIIEINYANGKFDVSITPRPHMPELYHDQPPLTQEAVDLYCKILYLRISDDQEEAVRQIQLIREQSEYEIGYITNKIYYAYEINRGRMKKMPSRAALIPSEAELELVAKNKDKIKAALDAFGNYGRKR